MTGTACDVRCIYRQKAIKLDSFQGAYWLCLTSLKAFQSLPAVLEALALHLLQNDNLGRAFGRTFDEKRPADNIWIKFRY